MDLINKLFSSWFSSATLVICVGLSAFLIIYSRRQIAFVMKRRGPAAKGELNKEERRRLNRIENTLSNTLASIGLGGTFAGILITILGFAVNNGEDDSLLSMAVGVAVALITSIFGVGLSARARHKLECENYHFGKKLIARTGKSNTLLEGIKESADDNAAASQKLIKEIVEGNDKLLAAINQLNAKIDVLQPAKVKFKQDGKDIKFTITPGL